MRTKNIYYCLDDDFNDFIKDNYFINEENLLVQIFSSELDENILKKVIDDILKVLPQAKIIGATTDGEIIENRVTTDKIVISITAFEKATLSIEVEDNNNDSFSCGKELAKKLVKDDTKALFIFTDGLHTNGEIFLNGVQSISKDIVIAGGMAGDAGLFKNTYILSNDGVFSSGAVGVAIHSKSLHIKTSYSFNWQEIGKILTVTKAEDNRVYEIDGKTAVDIYAQYLGEEIAQSLPAIGIEFPLIIDRDGVKIARAVLGKEDDGSLIFAGNLSVGDKVNFGYGNSGMILRESVKMKAKYKNIPIESIFVYSCMARRRFLEQAICLELTPLAKLAPTSGFFTYGEFFKEKKCELLNQTMTTIAMSEDTSVYEHNFEDETDSANLFETSSTHKALSHLIQETSRELKETNDNLEKLVEKKTKALQKKVEELENASKVKSEFLAGMSHEIRTPLNAILGFVDILKSGEKDKERQKRFTIIKNSGASLLTIINDILDFSKIESGKMILERRKFATKKPFKEVSQLFYEKAKEDGIDLKITFDPNLPRFFVGDIVRIKQVASNFLSNAIKFTPKGGKILISLEFDTSINELKFSVKDSGIGIDEKNLNKIFESFTQEDSTTTRKFGGTGLGLSISTALINSMDGKITVDSVLDEGSTFSFLLPILEAENLGDYKEIPLDKIDLNMPLKGNVLLVEDNKTNQMLMKILLDELELDVEIAENGLEAVKMFKENRYDLILMDENMPKMNGIEATKIILDLEEESGVEHTPIIALTANALATDRAKFLGAGMDEFVSKPVDHDNFVRVLHSFLVK
ncbi:MAG: FIST N-terminal domain-containing protein [Campylobacterota bacterium]|nr:FIST N-terminal domain-containing protein [Campylobacterota bacterium]